MRVEVRIGAPVRRWHVELLRQLSADSPTRQDISATVIHPTTRTSAADATAERVLGFERLLNTGSGLSRRIDKRTVDQAIADWTQRPSDTAQHRPGDGVVLDLAEDLPSGDNTWSLRFDGRPGVPAGLAALRSGRCPEVRVLDGRGRVLARGVPGSENPGALAVAYDDLLSGCIVLIRKALAGARALSQPVTVGRSATSSAGPTVTPPPAAAPAEPSPEAATVPFARHVLQQTGRAAMYKAYRTLYRAPHWRVGWRWVDGPGLLDDPAHPPAGWTDLPDDGLHFYADPFPFEHGGRHYLFVEDFEHRRGRGVIAVTEFDDNGPIHKPVVALTHDVHLSYPFVVADQGELWMIPETSGAGTIELYRATQFPYAWSRERVLLAGLEASDATVFRHQGSWWMTATVRQGGSFSDALHLWHAEQLTGPWLPHRDNPVLVDISAARPAGRVVQLDGAHGGRLIRPVQDGRTGYGAALAIAEITKLDENRFEQHVVSRLQPGSWWPSRRIHTINRAGRLECIDGSAFSPRFRRRNGLPERPVE